MKNDRKPWQFLCQCTSCKDIIYSRFDGEYRVCKCGATAVDQTSYYWRAIGQRPKVLEEDEQV